MCRLRLGFHSALQHPQCSRAARPEATERSDTAIVRSIATDQQPRLAACLCTEAISQPVIYAAVAVKWLRVRRSDHTGMHVKFRQIGENFTSGEARNRKQALHALQCKSIFTVKD